VSSIVKRNPPLYSPLYERGENEGRGKRNPPDPIFTLSRRVKLFVSRAISAASEILVRRVFLSDGNDSNKERDLLKLLKKQLTFPLFFTSFFGINENSGKDEKYAETTDDYSPQKRKFLKKITRKSQYENCFTQISYCHGYKFNFLNFFHIVKLPNDGLSVKFIRERKPPAGGGCSTSQFSLGKGEKAVMREENKGNIIGIIRKLISSVPIIFLFVTMAEAVSIRTSFVSVSVSGVVPGKEFSLKERGIKTLKIYNRGSEDVTVKVAVLPEKLEERCEQIRDSSWIEIKKDTLKIPAGSFAETDIIIKVPKMKEFYGRKFSAVLFSAAASAGGNLSAGLKSKLFFETVERKSFFKRLFGR